MRLLGHRQELTRHFNILSLIGLASTTTISWTGLGLGLIAEINAGGPGAGRCHLDNLLPPGREGS
jgi:choline transport protein